MLVLSRKISEEIIIGGNIRVMVVDVRGDTVRIGIQAPRGVSINRSEIQEAKDAQRIQYGPHDESGEDFG